MGAYTVPVSLKKKNTADFAAEKRAVSIPCVFLAVFIGSNYLVQTFAGVDLKAAQEKKCGMTKSLKRTRPHTKSTEKNECSCLTGIEIIIINKC